MPNMHNQDAFLSLNSLVWIHRSRAPKRRPLSRGTIVSQGRVAHRKIVVALTRSSTPPCMQKHSNTIEDMQKDGTSEHQLQHDMLTREQREHAANKWQLTQTSRGGRNTTINHPEHGFLLNDTEVHRVSDDARCKRQKKIQRTDAIAKLSVQTRRWTSWEWSQEERS